MAFTVSVAGVDRTSALLYGSITLKLNTIDFSLFDPAVIPALGDALVTTDPAWTGSVTAVTTADPVDLRNSHVVITVTGTNTNALPNDTAPFDLSDVPVVFTDKYLLEDGTSHLLLEAGTDFAGTTGQYLLEGALSYGYSGLSVRKMAGTPPTTLGSCTVQQPGLRPGNTVHVTSLNQGLSAVAYQINQASLIWQAVPPVPVYTIEFGDTPQTLAAWTLANATPVVAAVTPPTVVNTPPTVTILGLVTVGHALWATGGGIVTVATATFTVTSAPGRTLTCQVQGQIDARMRLWDNYIAAPRRAVRATLSGGLFTGAWQELPFGLTRAVYDLSSASGIAMPSGTYTVNIQIDTVEFNQIEIFSGWVQAVVTST
jgi:hypothetical protein